MSRTELVYKKLVYVKKYDDFLRGAKHKEKNKKKTEEQKAGKLDFAKGNLALTGRPSARDPERICLISASREYT